MLGVFLFNYFSYINIESEGMRECSVGMILLSQNFIKILVVTGVVTSRIFFGVISPFGFYLIFIIDDQDTVL